jgi:hypothetical protein
MIVAWKIPVCLIIRDNDFLIEVILVGFGFIDEDE